MSYWLSSSFKCNNASETGVGCTVSFKWTGLGGLDGNLQVGRCTDHLTGANNREYLFNVHVTLLV